MTVLSSRALASARFAGGFAALLALVTFAEAPLAAVARGMAGLYATVVAGASGLAGAPASVSPDHVVTFVGSGFSYHIVEECTALSSMLFLVGAIAVFPGLTIQRRVSGAVAAFAVVSLVNVVRLLSLAWLGAHGFTTAFKVAHVYVWVALEFALFVAVWYAAVRAAPAGPSSTQRREGARAVGWAVVLGVAIVALTLATDLALAYTQLVARLADPLLALLSPSAPPIHARAPWWTEYAILCAVVVAVLVTGRRSWPTRARAALLAVTIGTTLYAVMIALGRAWVEAQGGLGPGARMTIHAVYAGAVFAGWMWWTRWRPAGQPRS